MALNTFVKSLQNIMRKDSGVDGDAQRLYQIAWMLFLKVYDAREEEWEYEEDDFVSILPEECRWRNWAHDKKDGKSMTGEELLTFVNQTLFPTIKSLEILPSTPRKKALVKSALSDMTNYMKDGVLLRQMVNEIDAVDFNDYAESHAFNDIYEALLKSLQSAGNAGEFYTPRAVTDFVVDRVSPKLGESVADFACGTGGFLVSALKVLEGQMHDVKTAELFQNAVFGSEWKPLPHLLSVTNLLLHGVDAPNIRYGDSLERDVREYEDDERFDVVVMNPPYGGATASATVQKFPADMRTSETASLFMVLILYRLKEAGRVGIVLSDGFLFANSGAERAIKEKLLTECNLHTVIRLPESVFAPYTSIATNLLFFDKTGKTEETWFYRLDMPEGYKHFSKTKPMKFEHFAPVLSWWDDRVEIEDAREDEDAPVTYKAKKYSFAELEAGGFSLDYCGFPKITETVLPPDELLADYYKKKALSEERISKILAEFESVLRKSE